MTIPTSSISTVEVDLLGRGYERHFWRRGVMGTRAYAKGSERVVLVRNVGVDRHPQDEAPSTPEHWFGRLQAALDGMVRGATLTDVFLFGDAGIQVPEAFMAWGKAHAIRIHTAWP